VLLKNQNGCFIAAWHFAVDHPSSTKTLLENYPAMGVAFFVAFLGKQNSNAIYKNDESA
jgi:hypothetical protein